MGLFVSLMDIFDQTQARSANLFMGIFVSFMDIYD